MHRAFLPMLQRADEGHIVNTSSVNIDRATYSTDRLRGGEICGQGLQRGADNRSSLNAPHIKCSVVMPGHVGTSIPLNSRKIQSGAESDTMEGAQFAWARARLASTGRDASSVSDDELRTMVTERERRFVEDAPTSAAEAATIILDGVKADRWHILVGKDAKAIDERVRRSPEEAYEVEFFESFARDAGWRLPV
jgi:NAD(P)-dependent dehydrogenase (short-subunit alcohol dehydrogenase family)